MVTVALTCARVAAVRDAGGIAEKAIVGAFTTADMAVAGFEGVVDGAAEDAVIVTTPPPGTAAGAV